MYNKYRIIIAISQKSLIFGHFLCYNKNILYTIDVLRAHNV
jgi:hypothetical protein